MWKRKNKFRILLCLSRIAPLRRSGQRGNKDSVSIFSLCVFILELCFAIGIQQANGKAEQCLAGCWVINADVNVTIVEFFKQY